MTSPANQQNSIPATNTATTAASYASAAGAPKKPAQPQAPVVATGSQAPVVVGSSASPAQNANKASPSSSVNGKSAAPPAVPAVARGSSTSNGHHVRQSSVTMAANGPANYVANGGPVSGSKIQFGFDSPSMPHGTPQAGNAAPIPIPGGNPRITSPAHSPSPIPQPSASGGRPPSGLQQPSGQMTFGSLSSDSERHMRQGSVPPNPNALGSQQPGTHFRRESNHSIQSDNPGGPNRNFHPQGGRGRGNYNPHGNSYNNQMGYPPNNNFRNGQGRGNMPPAFQPQRNMAYPNSPQPHHRSPALVTSIPSTPNMPPANVMPMQGSPAPQYHYSTPVMPHQQVQSPYNPSNNKPFKASKKNKPRRDSDKPLQQGSRINAGREVSREVSGNECNRPRRYSRHADPSRQDHGLNHAPTLNDQHSKQNLSEHPSLVPFLPPKPDAPLDMSPGNYEQLMLTVKQRQNYGYPPQQMNQYGQPAYGGYGNMGYMPPQQSGSPAAFNQGFVPPGPYHAHGMSRTPSQPERPPSASQQAAPVAMGSAAKQPNAPGQTNNFVKPRKSAAIQIKTSSGEVVDTSSFKVPASPAPSGQQVKTPPVVTSTPTPPPKSSTPGHSRTDSHTAQKTAKQIQDELREKIKQATQAPQEKPKEEKPAEPAAPVVVSSTPAAPAPAAADKPTEPKAEPAAAAPSASDEKTPENASEKAAAPAVKEAEKSKAAEEPKPAEPAASKESEEEELDRIIREMEEAEAAREAKEAEHQKRREAEKAAAKEKDEEQRKKNAADEDRKLREQEREMERLEDEKEKKRLAAEKSGEAGSVEDALAGRVASKKEGPKVDTVADKLASMKIDSDKPSSPADLTGQKPTTAEKRGVKPAALNLAPLKTNPVEPPQPSAALQSLKSARFLQVMDQNIYPAGIKSPNPALNAAVQTKGKTFKYDANFLLQFQKVFTEQPSLEFHQQVKTLIGDGDGNRSASRVQTPGSARQGSRGGGAGFQMGTFNAPPGGRTLPPGTNSADRFAMANNSMARPQINPMNSFQRPGGAFPISSSMSRTSSQSNMTGSNSNRQGSRNTRGGSRRDPHQNQKDAQAAKTMPLTQGQDLKPIAVSATGWKPSSVGGKSNAGPAGPSGHLDPQMVQRKVKAALNKMTPENFDRISEQILTIASQSKDESDGRTLRQVIQLTFEKATDEAHWASMYAKFCKRMLETMNPEIKDEHIKDKNGNIVSGGNLFRKYLLNRCQEEFERGWSVNLPEPKEEEGKKNGEAVMLSDEYYAAAAAKRRGLGLVQFIGELYKLGMLTERIMLECVHKLVDYKGVPDEAEIESLSKLLRTIGANLDMSEKGRPMMDVYFGRIQQMMDMPELPSRLKFMLLDVMDLRRAGWRSKELNKGPKTLEEVRAEAEAAQIAKAQEAARTNQRGGGGGRAQTGRGDARNFSASGYGQQTSNQVAMDDLRRLKGSTNRASSQNISLGPTSMFSSRSNSGRQMRPGGSLGRPGEESGASSRTGTPPVRENASHSNAFSLLANMETENPASPPSTAASPSMSKAVPDEKKDGE